MNICFFLEEETGKEGLVFLCSACFCKYYIHLYAHKYIYTSERAYWPQQLFLSVLLIGLFLPLEHKGSFPYS